MKRLLIALITGACMFSATAQDTDSNFKFKFYGRMRAELFYNSRASNETVDGIFHMYPKDHEYDADGNDLNATAEGNMYCLYTRLGVDIKGPDVASAKASAKVEVDFRGNSTQYSLFRVRHAYVNLDWGKSDVLVGQTWHPMFGDVSPNVLNVNTGAPYQPFNRSPQVRYRYIYTGVQFIGAAVWQMQYTSAGPEGKTHNYIKNSCVPELFAGIDYVGDNVRVGVGAEMLSLVPRRSATVGGRVYKVNERITTFSAEAHAKYTCGPLSMAAKTTLGNNLTHTSMLGGYGVTDINDHNGECKYTPFTQSASWINIVYGKKWQPGLFVGYMKNLGTGKPIKGKPVGVGLDVDQLVGVSAQLSYSLSHWKMGVELSTSTAWYGDLDLSNGRINNTHAVTNLRALAAVMYSF